MSNIRKLEEIAQKIKVLGEQVGRLSWAQYTTGFDFGITEAYFKLSEELKNKKNYETILNYREKDLDPIDKRRVEIMYNVFKPYHLGRELNEINLEIKEKTNEVSKVLNTFRYTLDGKEITSVEITQILTNEEDREKRKKAYFSRSAINKALVDAGFIELINLRKQLAKEYGAKDFVEYQLKNNELSPTIFDNWQEDLDEMLPLLDEKRKEYANKYLNEEEMMPWDEEYINTQIAPSINTTVDMSDYYNVIANFYRLFGFDIDKYSITYDIFPRKNKSQWGYNFPIEVGKDSRILANVKNKYYEYRVLLHETGHGVHFFLQDPEESILNAGISGIVTEGIANLFGGFLYDEMFYKNFFGDEVKEEFAEMAEYDKLSYLRFIGTIFFDHALYRNDIETLDDIYDVYFKVYNDLFGDKPHAEQPPFGYRIHYTTHPIYLHNYFMGDVTCEMIKKVFLKKYGLSKVSENPKLFGEFLVEEAIKPSGLYKYEELFKKISGEDFSLKWYL